MRNSGVQFEFATASKVIFGKGSLDKVPGIIAGMGNNVLIVTGKNQGRAGILSNQISGKTLSFFSIESEPTIEMINVGVQLARTEKCNLVIGFGGGSVIDAAKAIAALVPNDGELMDYLEVIGDGKPLLKKSLPVVAVPTTSGTGAEVTKNAVIKSEEHHVKVSLRSDFMYPDFAVVDPEIMVSMPTELTASTGVDALTHLLETFVSNQSNPFIDMFCREGMKRISQSLETAYFNGSDLNALEDMAMASLLGGMALANVKLGAVHGFAGPVGGMFPAPHGVVCARFLPAVMEMNIAALTRQNADISKFDEIAKILTQNELAVAEDGIVWVKNLVQKLKIASLSSFGITSKDFTELAAKAKNSSSMKGNPVVLNDEELIFILEKSV
ncbi:MAG: iron-containing alcohol dehydrogenase [Draconibacterium sp.]